MKKLLVLMLTLVLTLGAVMGLTACGKTSKTMVVENLVLAQEEYGIAAKKGNDALMEKINEALIDLADDKMQEVATTYGLNSEIAVTASTVNPLAGSSDESWANVVGRNKIVIGYTIFAPIAFDVVDEVPTKGYDIDLAKEVISYLNNKYSTNIEIEFLKIEWSAKETLLANGSIDLVWNGMTITQERLDNMCISVPYLYNKQVAVILDDNAETFTTIASMADAIVGAEKGSAGEGIISAQSIGGEYVECTSQLDAYNMLKAGTLQVIVIDSIMANYYIALDK